MDKILEVLTNPAFYAGVAGGSAIFWPTPMRLPPKIALLMCQLAIAAIALDQAWQKFAMQDPAMTIASPFFWGVFASAAAISITNDFFEKRRT